MIGVSFYVHKKYCLSLKPTFICVYNVPQQVGIPHRHPNLVRHPRCERCYSRNHGLAEPRLDGFQAVYPEFLVDREGAHRHCSRTCVGATNCVQACTNAVVHVDDDAFLEQNLNGETPIYYVFEVKLATIVILLV